MVTKGSAKVAIGMSGGVDSSTAASLLKENGYDVIGVTIRTHESESAVQAAREAAEQLGIPFYVFDFRGIFREKVIEPFKDSYHRGETPNPCVVCNRYIKFGAFLEEARKLGASFIATGHYVQKEYDEASGRFLLYTGLDNKKDQSYMLYSLSQDQIASALFPLGTYTKEEVRALARDRNLTAAEKKESQEICFIPDNDYASYITSNTDQIAEPGDFVDVSGQVLGKHQGLIHYTVGQRKGLGSTFGKPMFVVALDSEHNRVILGDNADIFSTYLWASDINWIAIDKLRKPLRLEVKIRYHAKPAFAMVYPENEQGLVRVEFETTQRAVTPGQSVVFYKGPLLIGGGVIQTDKP